MITPIYDLGILLYNGTIPHVQGSQTSELAAESMEKSISGLRRDVLDCVSARPDGATCDEVEQILSMRHQTASARCRELVLMGKLERRLDPTTGKEIRRLTRSGRTASVLFAAPLPSENGPSVASSSPCHD